VLSWLRVPTQDDPAEMLRWVRRLQLVMIPVGLLIALLLRAEDLGAWWLGLVVCGGGVLSVATIGPSIRRAERHGPNDPATRPQRARRAERLTLIWVGGVIAAAAGVGLAVGGVEAAIAVALIMGVSAVLGIWTFRRWMT